MYDRLMAIRPSAVWQQKVDEESAQIAAGTLSPDRASAVIVWPESLRAETDAALAAFEGELRALASPTDDEVFDVVKRLVLVLNEINERHESAGLIGYETGERDELCWYIDASLEESGVDVAALEARHEIEPGMLIGAWRNW
jgi:hypothetical protein